MRRGRVLAGVLAVATIAWATSAPATTPPPPTADEWLFTCDRGEPFSLDVFAEPGGAEALGTPPAKALQKLLADGRYDLPLENWRILSRTPREVQFGHGQPGGSVLSLVVEPRRPGSNRWWVAGFGGCDVSLHLPDQNRGEWKPRHPDGIGKGATSIKVWIQEQACASGKSPGGRIRKPLISYEDERIVIAARIEPQRGGFQTCPGNPFGKYTFRLSEPIGDRVVVDGFAYPFEQRLPPQQR